MSDEQIKIEHKVNRLIHFMNMIKNGQVKIPSFKRDYIWTSKQKIELFESIALEYPIGTILLWKPEKKFKIQHELGPFTIERISPNGFFYILDGFQRLSTLFGCLTNPNTKEFKVDKTKVDEFSMYYDLEKEEFNIPRNKSTEITNLPLYTLFDTFGFLDFSDDLRSKLNNKEKVSELIRRGKKLSSILIDYQLPYVEIHNGSIEQAVNIFSRVNSKGSPISLDWMVSALTTNEAEGFNLGNIIEELLDNLKTYNFEDLKREIVLQCIQTAFGKLYIDEKIEDLITRTDFTEKTRKTIKSIEKAVKFLFEELLVLGRKLLPYDNQLVYLSYFFNEVENPTREQKEILKEWFWITTYSNYFTIYSLSKIRISFEYFKDFVEGKRDNPIYNDKPNIPFVVADFPKKNINLGSVRSTALVLFLLNYSNNFKPINAEKIDGFKFEYLVSGGRVPENIVPVIKHTDSSKDIILGKHKDLTDLLKSGDLFQPSLFNRSNINTLAKTLFIDKKMAKNAKGVVLKRRKKLMINAEKIYVQVLGLEYEVLEKDKGAENK